MVNEDGSDLNREELPPVSYSSWARETAGGQHSAGYVAVYHDETGTWLKVSVNGVVRSYEQIAPPEQAAIR